jgi:SAM-dependent methyltransferase
MDERYAEHYYQMERDHAWSVTRRDVIVRLLDQHRVPRDARILDAGCSGGALLAELRDRGYANVHGVDFSPLAVNYCHQRGLTDVRVGDASAPDFAPASMDCIVASDILEHIEDEQAALRSWGRLLAKDGLLICFVPAFQFLWSQHDVLNHHVRRYRRSELVRSVVEGGFEIVDSGYWNSSLFAPVAGARLLERARGMAGKAPDTDTSSGAFRSLNRPVNFVLTRMMKAENRVLLKGLRLPFGVSAFVIARHA